ncbi:hypothetical protein HaLaN_18104 [Haematococcus lacustris]|uniref:Uncharacterized protein n=1 Tax=Haematococcus lacustris TaxID=44745 RepID=A0A699ZMR7_HAELA|nr:hypothetical protein HaLaN_18104 [Haematococcus lacustris]
MSAAPWAGCSTGPSATSIDLQPMVFPSWLAELPGLKPRRPLGAQDQEGPGAQASGGARWCLWMSTAPPGSAQQ